jgi:hypothetical protein
MHRGEGAGLADLHAMETRGFHYTGIAPVYGGATNGCRRTPRRGERSLALRPNAVRPYDRPNGRRSDPYTTLPPTPIATREDGRTCDPIPCVTYSPTSLIDSFQ